MAKGDLKVFDADCHVVEPPEVLDKYIDPQHREALQSFAKPGESTYRPNKLEFKRKLGERPADVAKESAGPMSPVVPRFRASPKSDTNVDPHARVADMDLEGIDVGMMIPTGVASFCSIDDLALELEVCRAYHRYMKDFCDPYPDRLKGTAVIPVRSGDEGLQELKRVAADDWAVAIFPSLPPGQPLDDPDLEPLWAAAAEHGFAIALHTFTVLPPYAPGARDGSYFDNYWIARSAAHPWCGMRNMASLLGSGVLDRHPELTIAVLEAGQGWLPYWVKRLDEQAAYSPNTVAAGMKPISEYVGSGRYFQSIELHEGEEMTKYVHDSIGPDVLMFSTDYPHGETWFPEAVDTFLTWKAFEDGDLRKLLWDNAARCFPRAVS